MSLSPGQVPPAGCLHCGGPEGPTGTALAFCFGCVGSEQSKGLQLLLLLTPHLSLRTRLFSSWKHYTENLLKNKPRDPTHCNRLTGHHPNSNKGSGKSQSFKPHTGFPWSYKFTIVLAQNELPLAGSASPLSSLGLGSPEWESR